jgi:carotenoid cleavage dioxygenase-like enzyme
MASTLQPKPTTTWSKAVLQSAQEFAETPLKVLSGSIPSGLRGSLYRNGPATLERGGQRVGHWFDGDGGILAVHFTDAGATGTYRYVQTEGYRMECQAGRFVLGGYGMMPPGPWWQRFGKDIKNVANTSVLALPDKLLALWEGGQPYALDLETLETRGLDDLGDLGKLPYSAHPKRDRRTGDIFNFNVSFGKTGTLNLFRSDRTGKIQQQGAIALSSLPVVHDFVLAGQYLVFCIPPVRINILPVLLQLQSFSDAMQWKPEEGTEIIVVDRDSFTPVCRFNTDPWYQWHFGNGYELADGSILVEIVCYPNFQTNQRLKELATGKIQTAAVSTFWQLRLDSKTGRVLERQQVVDRSCEFPVVHPNEVGQPSRYTYLTLHRKDADLTQDLFGAIARFDHQSDTLTEADLGENRYPVEPIYAPDISNPNQGWILTVVYDGNTNSSETWIYDAAHLDDEPVCRLALPAVIPLGFHGTWRTGKSNG